MVAAARYPDHGVNHDPSCEQTVTPKTPLLTLDDARARMLAAVIPVADMEDIPLAALSRRILAHAVHAPRDLPPADNSAMDGYAVRHADLAPGVRLRLIGSALAGAPFAEMVGAGECVRITTGGHLPTGADTVVIQEDVERAGDQVRLTAEPGGRGANVRRAGEDVARGERVLPAGRRLGAIEIGVLATLGMAAVTVRRRLRVALFASGDELRAPGEALAPGQIHDSNRYVIAEMLDRLGAEVLDLGIVRDDPERLRTAFQQGAANADLVITCGGASVGEADHARALLDKLGEVGFWKVALKPGKPFIFGRLGAALVCGLPGNPVSALVTFHQLVAPAIRKLQGADDPAPLCIHAHAGAPLRRNRTRLELLRGRLEPDGAGGWQALPDPQQSSGAFAALARCNAFILVPAGSGDIATGEMVQVLPFDDLL
ncbi:MAG: molybdopterin molybdotransferase MoeA [Gammaproteobacteria bacterium]|nr:molybdopterin molybdotransferase MoeA [Gammaproteobacteria bacterium]